MTRPCLVIGLGGSGIATMLASRRAYACLPGAARRPAHFVGIGLESDVEDNDTEGIVVLASSSMREALAHLDVMVDGEPAWKEILEWFPDRHRFVLDPPSPEGTGGARPLGRLAFWSGRHRAFVERVLVQRLRELQCRTESMYDRRLDVILLTSAWGGTGSAIAMDVAMLCRRLGRLCRQDLVLTLPSDAESGAFENGFATLADIALAQRSAIATSGPTATLRLRDLHVTFGPQASCEHLVVARLCQPLQGTLERWWQQVATVRFETPEARVWPRFHAASASALPLVRVEGSLDTLAATIDAFDESSDRSLTTTVPEEGGDSERRDLRVGAMRVWRRFLRGLDRVGAEARRRLRRWQRDGETVPEDDALRRRRSIEPDHLLIDKLGQSPSADAVKAVLYWIESDDLYADLEDVVDDAARAFELRVPSDLEAILSNRKKKWRGKVPDTTASTRRLEGVIASIRSLHALMASIENLSGYRRAMVPRGLNRRNEDLLSELEAEAISCQNWPDALGPLIRIAAIEILEGQLSEEAPSSGDTTTEPAPPSENVVIEVEVLEGHVRDALLSLRPTSLDEDALDAWLTELDDHRDADGGWWVPSPDAPSIRALLASCNVDVFVTRAAGRSPRVLVALIPEGLLWPGGVESLEAEIGLVAARELAADVLIVQTVLDRILFYVEERDQPLVNLEAIHRYREAYESHPHHATLHIDRRWAEGSDLAILLDDLGTEGVAMAPWPKRSLRGRGSDTAN